MIQKNTLSSDHEWMEVIRVCRSSGLSVREWCRTSGISRNSLYYHIRKLRAMGYDPACLPGDGTCEQEVVPLAIVESGSLSNECRSSQMAGGIAASIAIGNICVDIYNGAGSATIRDILSALTGGLPCSETCPEFRGSTSSPDGQIIQEVSLFEKHCSEVQQARIFVKIFWNNSIPYPYRIKPKSL